MAINYTKLSTGATLDAASLNDRFTGIQSSFNNLTKADVSHGALGRDHLPSLVSTVEEQEIDVTSGPYYHQYTRTSSA